VKASNRRPGLFLRGFSWAIALLVAFYMAGTPCRVLAQEPPAAQPPLGAPAAQPAEQPGAVSETGVEKEEERGENVYRHSALVKSAAKVLHLSTETTARTFEFINFAVVVLGLGIPLARFMPKYLRSRALKVSSAIESARKETADANARLKAVEAKLAHLDEEIAKYRAQVEEEMRGDETRVKAALEEESARIVASAEQEIGMAAALARRSLKHFAAELAVEQATRQIVLTPETDRALIAEFVSNAGKGGTN